MARVNQVQPSAVVWHGSVLSDG